METNKKHFKEIWITLLVLFSVLMISIPLIIMTKNNKDGFKKLEVHGKIIAMNDTNTTSSYDDSITVLWENPIYENVHIPKEYNMSSISDSWYLYYDNATMSPSTYFYVGEEINGWTYEKIAEYEPINGAYIIYVDWSSYENKGILNYNEKLI